MQGQERTYGSPAGDEAARRRDTAAWDADLYLKFADHRLRPALDLMARLDPSRAAQAGRVVYDLGCGTGNLTRILAERFPGLSVVGIDASAEMLAKARQLTPDPRVDFRPGDLAHFEPHDRPAVLYSNAAYHWIEGHLRLFPRLLGMLPPGGQLAIQMPRNHREPSHMLMRAAADAGPWRSKLAGVEGIATVEEPERYYDVLRPHCDGLEVWETVYQQPLTGADPVAAYTSGTSLRPFLEALQGDERAAFYAAYCALVREAYPARADGVTLFPFRRLFLVARRD